jgi:hypothetical protein
MRKLYKQSSKSNHFFKMVKYTSTQFRKDKFLMVNKDVKKSVKLNWNWSSLRTRCSTFSQASDWNTKCSSPGPARSLTILLGKEAGEMTLKNNSVL